MSARTKRDRSASPVADYHRGDKIRSRSPKQGGYKAGDTELPHQANPLSKHDLDKYKPLFALYLDVQKRLNVEDLGENELKGRWKSFYGKWNRGELSRGWYDPKTLKQAQGNLSNLVSSDDEEGEDEAYGPKPVSSIPEQQISGSFQKAGPAMPNYDDIQSKREEAREAQDIARRQHRQQLRDERISDRRTQKERLEEIIPRAQAGSHERRIEKKQEIAQSNRSFALAKEGGGDVEVREADLMGDEDSLANLKRMKKEQDRKKNERQLRKEEVLRVRAAEREEKVRGMRMKEQKTMEFLKEIAKARFGDNT